MCIIEGADWKKYNKSRCLKWGTVLSAVKGSEYYYLSIYDLTALSWPDKQTLSN